MKKKILSTLVMTFLCIVIFQNISYASTNTTSRTEDNLQIWDSITINSTVKKAALATPKVDESEKIYDFANLFTASQEDELFKKVAEYIDQYDMDMVIVTINNNNKVSSESYADDFYDYNYFGIGNTHDGILLLIDMDNRVASISTTGNAILMYDDSRINNILDYVETELKSSYYYNGALKFITYSSKYANLGIPSSNKDMKIDDNGNYVKEKWKDFNSEIDILFFILNSSLLPTIITAIIILYGGFSHKNVKKAKHAEAYLKSNSLNIYDRNNTFLNTNTTKTKISSSSSGFFGHSGGSSTHRGSSGISHGGGSRRF